MTINTYLYHHNKLLQGGGNVKSGLFPHSTSHFGHRYSNNLNRTNQINDQYDK